MQDKLLDNLLGIQRKMLNILGEYSTRTHHPHTLEEAIDDIWHPKCDVFQTETHWIILVELAGVDKQNISITTSDEFIRISGERNLPTANSQMCYYNMEIETGRFERRIFFPENQIDKDNPEVTYENGILRIAFPYKPVLERIIEIQ